MVRAYAYRKKPWLLTASLLLTMATVAMLAYALHYWKTTRDQLTALNNRVISLRQEQLQLNQALDISQRELQQQRLQMTTALQDTTLQPSSAAVPSDVSGNIGIDSPGATSRGTDEPSRQAAARAIGFLEMALRKVKSGRKAEEIIAALQQAREQLQPYAGFDSNIEALDVEIEKLYLLRQLENHLPDILLQSLAHEVQWLRFRHAAAPREHHQEMNSTAEPASRARRLLREHLREARNALRNRHEAQFHAALKELRGSYTRHFQPQPDFSNKLQQLLRTRISTAALDPSGGIARLLQQLEKDNDSHAEVEMHPSVGLNFNTSPQIPFAGLSGYQPHHESRV
jgi:hypothetical protein